MKATHTLVGIAISLVALTTLAYADTPAENEANTALDALDKGDYPTAERLITHALKEGGLTLADRELAYVVRAKVYIAEKHNHLAREDLAEALKLDPTDKEAAALQASLQKTPRSNEPSAIDCIDPASPDLLHAIALRNAQKYDEAIDAFSEIIGSCANDAAAYYGRGVSYGAKGFYDKSDDESRLGLADITHAIQLNPNVPAFFVARGSINENLEDCASAMGDYTSAIALDARDAETFALRASTERRCGDARGATADVNSALALDPTNARARLVQEKMLNGQ